MSKDRVESFSDSVFSIVLTLLVLTLTVPQIMDHASFSQYQIALGPVVPKFITFALTFATISVHWVSHHYFFTKLKRVTLGLVWINNILLFFICLMPFPAALLGQHFTDQFPVLLMVLSQFFASLTFLALRMYANKEKLFINDHAAQEMGPGHSLPAVITYSLAIILVFINVYVSLASLFIVLFIYFIPNFLDRKIK